MRRRSGLLIGVVLATSHACNVQSGATDGDCEYDLVTLDGSAVGFTSVGEWRSDDVCRAYCDDPHEACELVNPTTVKCQVPCG